MKKSILLIFGLLIAATAAYCIPNEFREFKELKVKQVIEKVISINHEAPVIFVDQVNIMYDVSASTEICSFENILIAEEKPVVINASKYRWHRTQRLNSSSDKANKDKIFKKEAARVNKRPDKK